jgi:hypothetical protein
MEIWFLTFINMALCEGKWPASWHNCFTTSERASTAYRTREWMGLGASPLMAKRNTPFYARNQTLVIQIIDDLYHD